MVEPPLLAGACQLNVTQGLLPVACRFCGAEGAMVGLDEASGIMLLLSATAGIERITIRRTARDSNTRLNLFK